MTEWTCGTGGTTTYSSSSSNNVWATWVDRTCGTANTAWETWCDSGTTNASSSPENYYIAHPAPTPEEIAAARQRSAEARRREQEGRKVANEKAEKLLRIHLTPKQQKQLDKQAAFLVESELKRIYRIKRGRTRNVEELDKNGKAVARFCIHPKLSVPDADTMLVQKLMLETCEAEFRRIANMDRVAQRPS